MDLKKGHNKVKFLKIIGMWNELFNNKTIKPTFQKPPKIYMI
jgi:hypothetical protein